MPEIATLIELNNRLRVLKRIWGRGCKRNGKRRNNPFLRYASQSITWLSASLQSRRCIFEQEKTAKEGHNERFLARAEGGGTPTAR
jgi:hypothetical protein